MTVKKGLTIWKLGAIDEFTRVNTRYTFLTGQRDDILKAKRELTGIIADVTGEMEGIFTTQFQAIDQAFRQTFLELFGGGKAALVLEDPEHVLDSGIEIKVQPPGKALSTLSLMSGGEMAFVAIALYFAILKVRPTPFCVMDEIEAALDEANVTRYVQYMRRLAKNTQFLVITHRRGTMEEADHLFYHFIRNPATKEIKRTSNRKINLSVSGSAYLFHILHTSDTSCISHRNVCLLQDLYQLLFYSGSFPFHIHTMYQKFVAITGQSAKDLRSKLHIGKCLPAVSYDIISSVLLPAAQIQNHMFFSHCHT